MLSILPKTFISGPSTEALKMEELVTKHSAIMDKYDPKKKIDLVVDEWGGWYEVEKAAIRAFSYQQNTMRYAVLAGSTLNIFQQSCRESSHGQLGPMRQCIAGRSLTDKTKMLLTPTYHVMKMYAVHQDAKLIPLTFESPLYTFNDKSLPAINVSASKDAKGLTHISLVNVDSKKQTK